MQMDLCLKVNGGMGYLMDKELSTFRMGLSTQAVGKMANMRVMEFMNQSPKLHMMGCGQQGCTMDKELLHGLMGLITLETGSIAKRMAMESMSVQMARPMRGIG